MTMQSNESRQAEDEILLTYIKQLNFIELI